MAVAKPQPPLLLLGALLLCAAYAAFADGAIQLPLETWLQLALLVIGTATAVTAFYGRSLRIAASPLAWTGVALFAAFVAWTGVTMLWSVAPDRSWEQLNRGLAYLIALALGMVVGSSLPRAQQRVAKGWLAVVTAVALFALAGKTIPGVLPAFDHAEALARLRAPLGYWNALALVCALAAPFALRLAADPLQPVRARLTGLGVLYLVFVTIGFTYSRGGILGLLAALLVMLVLGTEQLRSLALLAATAFASLFPLLVGFVQPDLSANGIPVERRTDDALVVLIVLTVAGAALLAFGRGVVGIERSGFFTPARSRAVGRVVLAFLAVLAVSGSVQAIQGGQVEKLADSFTETRGDAISDPSRLRTAGSGNRWTWWKEAAGAWADHPVGGWGAASFEVTHRMYREDVLGVKQPHNVPLQWGAETGTIGFLLALGGLLALIAAALSRERRARGYGLAAGAAGLAWLVHACFDWDWDIPGVTLPMLILLGAAVARPATPEPGFARRPGDGRALAAGAAVTLAALAVVSAALPPLADARRRAALEHSGNPKATPAQLEAAASDAELAARLNPLSAAPLFVSAAIAERRGSFLEARELLLDALEREPDNVDGWYRLARVAAALQDRAGNYRAAQRALELDPRAPAARAVADQALAALTPPEESGTATGSPIPEVVPVTDPRPALE